MIEFQWTQGVCPVEFRVSRIVNVIPVVVSCIHEVSSLESV